MVIRINREYASRIDCIGYIVGKKIFLLSNTCRERWYGETSREVVIIKIEIALEERKNRIDDNITNVLNK
jgi:hypothetical protein